MEGFLKLLQKSTNPCAPQLFKQFSNNHIPTTLNKDEIYCIKQILLNQIANINIRRLIYNSYNIHFLLEIYFIYAAYNNI